MKPVPAADGAEALTALHDACVAGRPLPVVLMDAQMPGMDGFALGEEIHRHPELAGTKIIVLYSAGLRGDAARCRELGVAAYLTKPVSQSELHAALVRLLDQQSERQDATPVALITRHSLREAGASKSLHSLVAEDDLVIQHLGQ
jgi:two-component system, sensor histidine kinase and response regulator